MAGSCRTFPFRISLHTRMDFIPASDCSLLFRASTDLSLPANEKILSVFRCLQKRNVQGITSISPAYVTLLIRFDPLLTDHQTLERSIRELLPELKDEDQAEPTVHKIPVCYSGPHSADLEDVAARTELTPADVIERHYSLQYRVYFLGFLPGFAYMGELHESISVPRRASPRPSVPRGSVAIAGRNTGIYPFTAPGGWHLIGRCPLTVFDPARENAALFAPGDQVRFHPVSESEFNQIASTAR
jgi:inhibitor of KinA